MSLRGPRVLAAIVGLLLVAGCAAPESPQALEIAEGGATGAARHLPVQAAAANPAPPSEPASSAADPQDSEVASVGETGIASWYGRRFHGRLTASGEPFDMTALTAAHPDLPFGTRVRVTNLANGRSVIVVINDRGPHVRGRLIDLSRAAAEKIGILNGGLAKVRLEVLPDETS